MLGIDLHLKLKHCFFTRRFFYLAPEKLSTENKISKNDKHAPYLQTAEVILVVIKIINKL